MPGVKVKDNETFDEAYRRFKKQADRNLIVTECRSRRFFESQTEQRKKRKINAKKKMLKRLYMLRRYESRL
ncbi:30S ribosomal protein S21 [Helicobacter didelphidarum]|uniref:Small ribosomal subunit protein bS21 n=1 Tax=Helicobacter didelphidarum TaxID=2040648 RepID=A0A3D8IQH1_9HELI|nr:30S ribosomal protein S21 [Helicobacter didelphidarum]RDU67519.1 30S ribosomal protein S21 [Helicobacter didelphidarum]